MAFIGARSNKAAEPPSYDEIAKRISTLGFFKLRALSRDYREHGCKWGIKPYGGFRKWLRETIDRQLDEEAAKSWEDSFNGDCGDYYNGGRW